MSVACVIQDIDLALCFSHSSIHPLIHLYIPFMLTTVQVVWTNNCRVLFIRFGYEKSFPKGFGVKIMELPLSGNHYRITIIG